MNDTLWTVHFHGCPIHGTPIKAPILRCVDKFTLDTSSCGARFLQSA